MTRNKAVGVHPMGTKGKKCEKLKTGACTGFFGLLPIEMQIARCVQEFTMKQREKEKERWE